MTTFNASTPEVDINTLLTQLKSIEGDRAQLLQQVQQMQEKIGKLTEGKKAEMQKALDTVINDWLTQSVNDETVREEFKKGMSRLVDQTAEDSGVWRVVCCASNVHAENLKKLEDMRIQVEQVKKSEDGAFKDVNNRKRGIEEVASTTKSDLNIWEQFAVDMKGKTFEPNYL
jgi:hypothetical protein